jgi:polyvinyl alcohol dehydrogenase (cytochrome)
MKRILLFAAAALLCVQPGLWTASAQEREEAEPSAPQPSPATADAGSASPSEALYQTRCSACHAVGAERVPTREQFRTMSPQAIVAAMKVGPMKDQADGLAEPQMIALAELLAGVSMEESPDTLRPNPCAQPAGPLDLAKPTWNGWGRTLENDRFHPEPGLKAKDVPRLKLKWAFAYPLNGRQANAQPTVVGDRLFATSQAGIVYSLNAKTGCTYWEHSAERGVRTSVSIGPAPASTGAKHAAYFGDEGAWVYSVDAETGRELWKTRVEEHRFSRITGSPILHGQRLYVPVSSYEEIAGYVNDYVCCTFRGSIVALDIATGAVVWKSYSVDEEPRAFTINKVGNPMYGPAGSAIWSAPTLDLARGLLYAATGNSYTDIPAPKSDAVIAFDLATGVHRWATQLMPGDNYLMRCGRNPGPNCPSATGPDYDFGASPILHTTAGGKQLLLIGQKSGMVYALDPQSGERIWERRVGKGSALGGIEFGMAADGSKLYAAVADHATRDGRPGLTALDAATGKILWHTPGPQIEGCERQEGEFRHICSPAQSAAVTAIPGIVFSGALNGHLRGYSSEDGRILWDFDTRVRFTPLNAAVVYGGVIDGGGTTVVGGVVYANSGYGKNRRSGNVLLAFTVDGK